MSILSFAAKWRHAASAALAAGLLASSFAAQSQPADYPKRAITIVVPFAVGLAPDIQGRLIAEALSKRIGVPVLVENRPGANGNIGTEAVARAKPDGYTLLICGLTCSIAKSIYKDIRFDVKRDLAPLVNIGTIPSVLVVAKDSPFQNIGELIAHAKAHPDELTFASVGIGGSPHLAGELLKRSAGVDLMHIPFGSGDPLVEVGSGRVTMMFIPGVAAQNQQKLFRLLGVASAQRDPALPDVPTFAESGIANFEVEPWNGIWAPSGTPEPVLDYLNEHLQAVLAQPDVAKRLQQLGLKVVGGTRAAMAEYFDADTKKWAEVVEANGIVLE